VAVHSCKSQHCHPLLPHTAAIFEPHTTSHRTAAQPMHLDDSTQRLDSQRSVHQACTRARTALSTTLLLLHLLPARQCQARWQGGGVWPLVEVCESGNLGGNRHKLSGWQHQQGAGYQVQCAGQCMPVQRVSCGESRGGKRDLHCMSLCTSKAAQPRNSHTEEKRGAGVRGGTSSMLGVSMGFRGLLLGFRAPSAASRGGQRPARQDRW
jgi:hypothetical protein